MARFKSVESMTHFMKHQIEQVVDGLHFSKNIWQLSNLKHMAIPNASLLFPHFEVKTVLFYHASHIRSQHWIKLSKQENALFFKEIHMFYSPRFFKGFRINIDIPGTQPR